MTLPLSPRVFWVLVFSLSIIISGAILYFCCPDKDVSNPEKERSLSGKLQEQPQVQTSHSNTQPGTEVIPEKPADSFKEVSGMQPNLATIESKEESLGDITSSIGPSYPLTNAANMGVSENIIKDYEAQFAKAGRTLEETKSAFNEAFTNKGNVTHSLMSLIRQADEEEKNWLRGALISRFNSDLDPANRRTCLVCITMFREAARHLLALALTSDSDRGVQRLAAYALGQGGSEQEVEALLQAVKKDKGVFGQGRDIARIAISSLGEIGGEEAILALNEIWNNEDLSRGCREQTLSALGMAGDPGSLRLFEDIIRGKEEMMRDTAALGLGRLARKIQKYPQVADKAITLLRSYINDDNAKVRRNVVYALGWVGVADDIHLLKPFLDDNYSSVVSYTEAGERKKKVVYPIRERAKSAIDRINARLMKKSVN